MGLLACPEDLLGRKMMRGWLMRLVIRAVWGYKRTEVGIPNSELQEYIRNITGTYLPGSSYSYRIPTILLRFSI